MLDQERAGEGATFLDRVEAEQLLVTDFPFIQSAFCYLD
jgi:hypothetical protein